jgi:hypothetical protein
MNDSWFDELTKALANATSHRQALKAFGATLGGILGLSSIGTAFAGSCIGCGGLPTCNACKHFCENVPIPLQTCLCGIRKIIVPHSGKPQCFMCGPTPDGSDAGPCPPGQICVNSACIPCPSGTTFCNNQCVQNCSGGQVLNPTTCSCQCPAGSTLCGGNCVSVSCSNGQVFNPTSCVCDCAPGTVSCSGTCVNLSSDPNNCGSCGNVCTSGTTCSNGTCVSCLPPGAHGCTQDSDCCQNVYGGQFCDSTGMCNEG